LLKYNYNMELVIPGGVCAMGGRRGGERKIVIRSKGRIPKAEMRQSILRYLLQEYDMQGKNLRGHPLQEYGTGAAMGRGSGSDAGDRE